MSERDGAGRLTEAQRYALDWIDRFPCTVSEWKTDGKSSNRPHTWNEMHLSGARGSIVIPVKDWDAIRQYLEPARYEQFDKQHAVTDAGRRALNASPDQSEE